MRRILYELTTAYAAAAGCSCEMKEGSCRTVLAMEGITVNIGIVESSGMLLFQTGVALLPAGDCREREEFCLKLLSANNLFRDTFGFTLGVDEEQQMVTVQIAWDARHLDNEGFSCLVNNLLAVSADWMLRLDAWRPSPPETQSIPGDDILMHSLKV